MGEIGLFEAIHTARSLRRFHPDPVPDALITQVLDAAIRAPSGGNSQHWVFVVVRDAALRQRLGAIYRQAAEEVGAIYAARPDVGCVVHAHPPCAVGLTVAGVSLESPVVPEILFAIGARRLRLSTLGILQYIAPSVQFVIAIAMGEPFTAVVCANDQTAFGLQLALHHRGLRVPDDVSVVGFDDLSTAAYFLPPLTTVRQPVDQMGDLSAQALLMMIDKREPAFRSPAVSLVVRESTRRIETPRVRAARSPRAA